MPSLMRLLLSGATTLKSLLSLSEPPKPPIPYCKHTRCPKKAVGLTVVDDHDSNVGTWEVRDYCSLDCLVCDLKHAWDARRYDGGKAVDTTMNRLK